MTHVEQAGTVELSREECLSLLVTAPFGRLVLTEGALPAVLPVNFLLDAAGIVIRTSVGSSTISVALNQFDSGHMNGGSIANDDLLSAATAKTALSDINSSIAQVASLRGNIGAGHEQYGDRLR